MAEGFRTFASDSFKELSSYPSKRINLIMQKFSIESPAEVMLNATSHAFTPDSVASTFRGETAIMFVPKINKGNPAFKDWSKRLKTGERLPRGKFFRVEERMRIWRTPRKLAGEVKYITLHAS